MNLDAEDRRELSPEDFAIPPQDGREGRYPIPDRAHAIDALAQVDVHGTPEEKQQVRATVRDRYPDLPSSGGDEHPDTRRAGRRARKHAPKHAKP